MLQKPKQKWWQLYALVPLMVGLLVLEAQAAIPPIGHQFSQIGVVLLTFGLMALWVRANQAIRVSEEEPRALPMNFFVPQETMWLNPEHLQSADGLEYTKTGLYEFDTHFSKGRYN